MSDTVLNVPALLFFTILCALILWSRRVHWLEALCFVCLGLFLAGNVFGDLLRGIVLDLGTLFGGGH